MAQSSNLRNQLKTIITIAALLAATASPAIADWDNGRQARQLQQQIREQREQFRELEFQQRKMEQNMLQRMRNERSRMGY